MYYKIGLLLLENVFVLLGGPDTITICVQRHIEKCFLNVTPQQIVRFNEIAETCL